MDSDISNVKEILVGVPSANGELTSVQKMSPAEFKKKEEADVIDAGEEVVDTQVVKQLEKEGFISRLSQYNKPVSNAVVGIFVSVI